MAFHKHYHAGEAYNHTAARENDISDALNIMHGFKLGKISPSDSGTVRCKCYNCSGKTLKEGQCVEFASQTGSMCGDAVPVGTPSGKPNLWAVLEQSLENGCIGSCIVAGCADIHISGEDDDFESFVVPDEKKPGEFKFSSTGTARVVFFDKEKEKAKILLGGASAAQTKIDEYDGPFAVKYDPATKTATVKGGWAVANGTWLTVAEAYNLKVTEPSYVCVSAKIKEKTWTAEIKVAEPSAENYPVAHTELKKVYLKKYKEGEDGYEESVDGFEPAPEGYEVKKEGTGEDEKRYYETLKVIQFYVSVATFMVVKYCPGVPQ